jgi:lipoprotein-anchoring transpeptidase ErfK/SrfK
MRWGLPLALFLLAVVAAPAGHAEFAIGHGCDGSARSLESGTSAWAAYAKHDLQAFSAPGGRPLEAFARKNENRVRTVFAVLGLVNDRDCRAAWYRVQLPAPPNGATGFISADAVVVHRVRTRIAIDLTDRQLAFFRDGRRVLSARVAIGSPATPTPTGRYYVNQRLRADDPSGPFGPGAIGISAVSPALGHWPQGGPIAVHGTDYPASIGDAVSHGCIRVRNFVLRRLFRATETGAPVVIRA